MKRQYICSGYQIKNGEIVINHTESKIIRNIFELVIEGNSAIAIAKQLNSEGVKTFMQGKEWNHGGILAIIRNKKYIGEDKYPRIIKPKMFNEANEKLPFVSKRQQNANHPLYGIVKCKTCGSKYRRYEKSKSLIFWSCPQIIGHGNKTCKKGMIEEKELINVLVQSVNKLIREPNKIEVNPQVKRFYNEREYKKLSSVMEDEIQKHSDIDTLLPIALKKAQVMYEGYDEINYRFRYAKLYDFLRDRQPYRRLDTHFLEQCVKEITLDIEHHLLTVELINDQMLINEFHMMSYPQ